MELSVYSDDHFMKQAINEAHKALEEGEVPVGAVLVSKNRIIARAHNQTQRLTDVTAHAEMIAITAGANFLNGKYLNDCTLYVTLEPCNMCAGALYWAQLGKLVYGASDEKRGYSKIGKHLLHPKTQVESGIMARECEQIIQTFFNALRNDQ